MTYRYSLSEVFQWFLTVAVVLAAMRLLTPLAFAGVSVVLLSSAAAWHFVESDAALVMFAALLGVVGAYLSVVQVTLFFAGDLGSFPVETIVGLGCGGCFYGAIIGVAVRVVHQGATRISSRSLGAKGWRGFAQFILIGYAIVTIAMLLRSLLQ